MYAVEYTLYDGGRGHSQVVASGTDLGKVQDWVKRVAKGQKWEHLSYTEGSGLGFRRVTNFSESSWSEYKIVKVESTS